MKVSLRWLKDFVALDLAPEAIAHKLTFAGLEVEDLHYLGLAPADGLIDGLPGAANAPRKANGLAWNREKLVVAQILEVMPHPNADRLTLLRLDDGTPNLQTVLTGAPNLFHLKGAGPLPMPIKVAYAREGAILYDGHKAGWNLMTLKRAKIRGVESYSMVCSEKELGLSEEHDGIIILDDEAPVGMPLADYMGDVVFTVKTNPNMARNINMLGVARELAALLNLPLRAPALEVHATGPAIAGQVNILIERPDLNPRFVAALIQGVRIGPSRYEVQRRLRVCGVRPINNVVDATNYTMLELGQPLHAFDYDVLVRRAGGGAPTLITRLPHADEKLTTLDGVTRALDPFTILVCDTAGALSLGGVMGGAESEVTDTTTNVLLEGAAWEFINIRQTTQSQKLQSEAAYRFARGIHPAMAERGVRRGIELMRQWAGGEVAAGLVDVYAQPAPTVTVHLPLAEVKRTLGVDIPPADIERILRALEFAVTYAEGVFTVTVPDHRLDIGEGVVGRADVLEEIARIYGFENIPETPLSDSLPPQRDNPALDMEEAAREALVEAGLQEVLTYHLTTPEREQRLNTPTERPYVTLRNPISPERVVMRQHLLNSVLEVVAHNARHAPRQALFEIGPVYWPQPGETLPAEPTHIALAMTGVRTHPHWQATEPPALDFFDLKGVVEAVLAALHVAEATFAPVMHPALMPGRAAELRVGGAAVGVLGELHPDVQNAYHIPQPVLVAQLDLAVLGQHLNPRFKVQPVPEFPPIKEDLAVVVAEDTPAEAVLTWIRQAGGAAVTQVALFDVFRGPQVGAGHKSLAYRLTYQAMDRTLSDADAAKIRARIVKRLTDNGAVVRSK